MGGDDVAVPVALCKEVVVALSVVGREHGAEDGHAGGVLQGEVLTADAQLIASLEEKAEADGDAPLSGVVAVLRVVGSCHGGSGGESGGEGEGARQAVVEVAVPLVAPSEVVAQSAVHLVGGLGGIFSISYAHLIEGVEGDVGVAAQGSLSVGGDGELGTCVFYRRKVGVIDARASHSEEHGGGAPPGVAGLRGNEEGCDEEGCFILHRRRVAVVRSARRLLAAATCLRRGPGSLSAGWRLPPASPRAGAVARVPPRGRWRRW